MRLLALIGFLAIVAAIGAAVYFFGGYYNVAASDPHPAIVDWVLVKVRQASVAKHAEATPTVPLDDAAIIQAGARAYAARGCATCHGAPGVEWAKFSEAVNPDPPDLKEIAKERTPPALFWVIKNGIKMTAMPAFGSIGVDDKEMWSIVAFVRKLPNVSEADFKSWTSPPPAGAPPASSQ
jgi:mono/diheme cytochrome c family protein